MEERTRGWLIHPTRPGIPAILPSPQYTVFPPRMAIRYYLPCSCGEKHVVDAAHAGLPQTCRCGAVLETPTLRGLQQLERVPDDDAPAPVSTWSRRKAMLLFGGMLMLGGLGFAVIQQANLPEYPTLPPTVDEITQRWAAELTLEQAFKEWETLSQGLPNFPSSDVLAFEQQTAERWRWTYLGAAVAGLGLILAGMSFCFADQRRAIR